MSRESVNYGITPMYLIGVPKAKEREKIKHIYRNNGSKLSKFDEIHKPRDLSSSFSSKHRKEENYTK